MGIWQIRLVNLTPLSYTDKLTTSETGKLQKVFYLSQLIFHHQYQFRFRKSKAGASLATKNILGFPYYIIDMM